MTDASKEFEVRLFNEEGRQFLIVPVVTDTEAEAHGRANAIRLTHGAVRYTLKAVGPTLAMNPNSRTTRDST